MGMVRGLTRNTAASSTPASKTASPTTKKIVDKKQGTRSSAKINKEFIIVAEKDAQQPRPGWGTRSSAKIENDFVDLKLNQGGDCLYNLPPHLWSLPVDKNTRLGGGIY